MVPRESRHGRPLEPKHHFRRDCQSRGALRGLGSHSARLAQGSSSSKRCTSLRGSGEATSRSARSGHAQWAAPKVSCRSENNFPRGSCCCCGARDTEESPRVLRPCCVAVCYGAAAAANTSWQWEATATAVTVNITVGMYSSRQRPAPPTSGHLAGRCPLRPTALHARGLASRPACDPQPPSRPDTYQAGVE